MKHKSGISTVLFLLLLLIGLGVLLYPTICDRYTQWQLSKEIGRYNQVAEAGKEDYSALWQAAEDYNRTLAEKEAQFMLSEEERELISTLLNPLGNGMIGYITIPKINVNLPVYQGTEEQELQSGAGWWPGSSLPTGGAGTHCIITAHTGLVKAKMFTDVDQLEIGDTFTLSVLDRELTYMVDQVLITTPDDMTELYIRDGKDYVTLYTCYPYGVNTHRLLVRGRRLTGDALLEERAPFAYVFAWWQIAILVMVITLVAAGIGMLLVLAARRRKAKRTTEPEKAHGELEGG